MSLRRLLIVASGVLLGLSIVLTGALAWGYRELHRPHRGWEGDSVDLRIEPGTSAGRMLDQLSEAGVVESPRTLRAWLRWKGGAGRLQAGEYRFEQPATGLEIIERLTRGDVLLYPVTLPEGLSLREIAERCAQAGFGTTEQFLEVFSDPTPIRQMDPEAEDLEGYLYPDTYHFPRAHRPEAIAAAMVQRLLDVIGPDYVDRAEAQGLTLREAVSLASMIEKETSVPDERRHIAQVFHNRLARGMKMECDPTVVYGLERQGIRIERLLYKHLRMDSPWNTYRVQGLPAGPIANPGRASLYAAIDPSAGKDIFFVAAPGGGHRFSSTEAAHLRAVAEWRRYQRSSR